MKKYLSILLVLVLIVAMACSFTGCKSLTDIDIEEALALAIKNSSDEKLDLFQWKETSIKGQDTKIKTVNAVTTINDYASEIEPKYDENGEYLDYRISVDDGFKGERYYVGKSKSVDKKNKEIKELLFRQEYDEAAKKWKPTGTMKPMTARQFLESEEFSENRIANKIAELNEIKVSDMDFNVNEGEKSKKINLITLKFGLNDEYFARYREKYGKESMFLNSGSVEIEIAYNRISHIYIYENEIVGELFGKETVVSKEVYKFDLIYLGPKFTVPSYDEKIEIDKIKQDKWQLIE